MSTTELFSVEGIESLQNIPLERVRKSSDPHYGHEKIIRLSGRPFESAEEMDAALIDNHNAGASDDTVTVFIGDMSIRSAPLYEVIPQLRGHLYLQLGNHDLVRADGGPGERFWRLSEKGKRVYEELGVTVLPPRVHAQIGEFEVTLCHYPHLARYGEHDRPNTHGFAADPTLPVIHGHTHSADPGDHWDVNVAVEARGYRPVSGLDILAQLRGAQ